MYMYMGMYMGMEYNENAIYQNRRVATLQASLFLECQILYFLSYSPPFLSRYSASLGAAPSYFIFFSISSSFASPTFVSSALNSFIGKDPPSAA